VPTEPRVQPASDQQPSAAPFDFEAQAEAEEGSLERIEMTPFESQPYHFRSASLPYVQSSLVSGERIVYCGRVHSAILTPGICFFLLATICLLLGAAIKAHSRNLSDTSSTFGFFGVLLYSLSLVVLISELIRKLTTELAVTNQRVIAKIGLISRRTLEMNIAKVENIQVDQGIFGRIFGFGEITVVGTGGTREPFRCIADPLSFRRAVQSQSHANRV
jgi:hypothetical protein